MSEIGFANVTKIYDGGETAVSGLTLDVMDGELMVLVGPSGCGKSTALRMIAGLEDISDGTLRIGGKVSNDLAPRSRNIAMVFQSYALYPHLTVAENIAFGLRVRGMGRAQRARRVRETAEMLELGALLDRKPARLSGGQRQRVAMGRALVRAPNAFLMDEPLSNLDARLRGQMRGELARLQRLTAVTTVYVTHDQVEAMTMGDRVAVMQGGALQQLDRPRAIYDRPCNLFVASFIGAPPMNFLTAQLEAAGAGVAARIRGGVMALGAQASRLNAQGGRNVILGVRPEALTRAENGPLAGRVALVEDLGASVLVHVDLDAGVVVPAGVLDESGDPGLHPSLRASLSPADAPRQGDIISFTAQPGEVHVFDAESGLAL